MTELLRRPAGSVLIVEDEPLLRMNAAEILEDEGFVIIEASSGEEGLRWLRQRADIRVLFTDVHMPGALDGLALARMAAAEHCHVQVLIVSGRAAPEPGSMPDGARFMAKPYQAAAIVAHIHEVMSKAID